MGRGLIIFIVGMFIVMGIMMFSSQNRLLSSEEEMARQVHHIIATNAAMSGLEFAAQQITLNEDDPVVDENNIMWADVIEGAQVQVGFEKNGNEIRLRSRGTSEGMSATVTGDFRIQTSGGELGFLEGALGVYSDDIGSRFDGRPHLINGCDHPAGVSSPIPGNCDLPGIAVDIVGNSNYDRIRGQVTRRGGGPPSRGVLGKGSPPSIYPAENTRSFVDEQIEAAKASALPRASGLEIGSRGNPMLTVVRDGEELRIAGSEDGAGIIIVEEGGKLNLRGNSTFQGLIIVQGGFHTAGTPTIWGGVIVGGENLEIQPEIRFSGTPKLKYSSEVMDDLKTAMKGGAAGRRMVLEQIFQ
ncbi:MAG: hypothetical protein LAT84_03080 [Balneolia bacterium]|nr:hypothetical protein [Balneolia bacterium]